MLKPFGVFVLNTVLYELRKSIKPICYTIFNYLFNALEYSITTSEFRQVCMVLVVWMVRGGSGDRYKNNFIENAFSLTYWLLWRQRRWHLRKENRHLMTSHEWEFWRWKVVKEILKVEGKKKTKIAFLYQN